MNRQPERVKLQEEENKTAEKRLQVLKESLQKQEEGRAGKKKLSDLEQITLQSPNSKLRKPVIDNDPDEQSKPSK